MKWTLIRCPQTMAKFVSAASVVPPIGLAYVASSLLEGGHEVDFIDPTGEAIDRFVPIDDEGIILRRGLSDAEILDRVDAPDVIGFSLMFSQDWLPARGLIRAVRERFPKAVLVAGGEHFAADPIGALEDSPLDYIIVGEGDRAVCDLSEYLQGKRALTDVPGVYCRTADGIAQTNAPMRIRDLDELPWPAWDLIPLNNYFDGGHGDGVNRGRSMPMLATRGCPYQCTFCSSPTMWTTRYTTRAPAEVVREIKHYVQKYGATNFNFEDLTAIVKKQWAMEFCQLLIKENLNITMQIPSGTRSEALDADVLPLLVQSGCTNLTYAPESGNEEILQRIKKKIHSDKMLESMRLAVKNGCNVKANLIFGFPEDTYSQYWQVFAFLAKMAWVGVHDISIAPFRPYPGSELFRQLQASGRLPKKLDDAYYHALVRQTENLPGTQASAESFCDQIPADGLERLRVGGLMLFFALSWILRPVRVLKLMRALVTEQQESRLDKALVEMKRRVIKTWRREPTLSVGRINPY